MIKITDADLRIKIAEIEGNDWIAQDAWSEQDAGKKACDQSVKHALTLYQARRELHPWQKPDHTTVSGAVIYGRGGTHRYFVLYTGEVVYSYGHGKMAAHEAEAVGFRIWK